LLEKDFVKNKETTHKIDKKKVEMIKELLRKRYIQQYNLISSRNFNFKKYKCQGRNRYILAKAI